MASVVRQIALGLGLAVLVWVAILALLWFVNSGVWDPLFASR